MTGKDAEQTYIHSPNSLCTDIYPPATDRAADAYKSCNDHSILHIVDKELNASHVTARDVSISVK